MYACWTVKGGSGTTVFASALALMLAERNGKATISKVDTMLALEDWSRTKTALDDAITHNHGEAAIRVRLVGDGAVFGIEPLGEKEKVGIQIPFERDAADAILKGADRVVVRQENFMRMAIPLRSREHAGCAECHRGFAAGLTAI